MIFKTIDDNDSLSGQRIVSKFTARKIAQEEAAKQLEIDIQCLRNYEAECQKGSVSTETFSNTMKGASIEAQRYTTNIKEGTGSASTFASNQRAIQASMSETSIVSKAATVGLNLFKAALNSLIFFAVIEGIQLLIKGIDNLILTAEEAEEKAETLRSNMQSFFDEVQSGQQTISSVSDRFSELSEHVTKTGENIDLTKDEYSEYLDICNQVKDIMPELVTGYTNEGNAIITLKDNVDSLTESYKKNIKAKAASFITNGDDDGNTIQSFFDDYDIFTNGENGLFAPSAGGLWNNKSTDYEDYYGYDKVHKWLSDVSEMSLKDLQNLQKGTTEATYLYALLKENGYELANITEDDYNAVHDVLTTRLTSLESEMTTRVSNIKMSLQQMLYADGDYWNIDDKEALSALDSFFASIDDEFIKQNNLLSQTALQSFESNAVDLFQNSSTKQSMIDIFTPQGEDESIKDYTTRVENAISEIQKYCDENGITIPFNFGTEDNPKGVQKTVNDLQKSYDNAISSAKEKYSEDLTPFFEENSINTQEEIDKWNEVAASCDTATEAKKKYLGTDSPEETPISSTDILAQVQALSTGLDQLDKIYADVYNKEDFDWSSILNNDGFKEAFGNMTNVTEDYKNAYDDFIKTISNNPADLSACQSAFDNLATAYIYNSDALKNVTEETKASTIAMLSQMGIVNAAEVVNYRLGASESYAADTGKDLESATLSEITAFAKEADMSDITKASLAAYVTEKIHAASITITTSADINNLTALCSQLGVAGTALAQFARLKAIAMDTSGKYTDGYKEYATTAADQILQNAVNAAQTKYTPQFGGGSATSKAMDDAAKSAKKASDTAKETAQDIDWIETKLKLASKETEKLSKSFDKAFGMNQTRERYQAYISQIESEIQDNTTAAQVYQEKLNQIGLSYEWIAKIQSGAFSIDSITDENLKTQISEYQTYSDKLNSCYDTIESLEEERLQASVNYAEKLIDSHEKEIDSINKLIDRRKALVSLKETFGLSASKSDLKYQQDQYEQEIDALERQNKEIYDLMWTTTYGDEAWQKYNDQMIENTSSIQDLTQSLADLASEMANLPIDKYEKALDKISAKNDLLDAKLENATSDKAKSKIIGSQLKLTRKKDNSAQSTAKTTQSNLNQSVKDLKTATKKDNIISVYNVDALGPNVKARTAVNDYYKKVQNYTKAKKQIPASLISKISGDGYSTLSKACANYNAALVANDTAQATAALSRETIRQELADLAEQRASLAKTTADFKVEKYDSKDELYDAKLDNAISTSSKNKLIDRKISNINNRQNAYNTAVKTDNKNIKSAQKNISKIKSTKENKKILTSIKKTAKAGKSISQSLLNKAAKLNDGGKLYDACIQYNAYLDAKEADKATADLYKETAKQDKATLAKEKFDNIVSKYDNKISSNEQKKTKINNRISLAEESGEQANVSDYKSLISAENGEYQKLIKKREELRRNLEESVVNGSIKKGSDEWYEMVSAINEVTNAIDESIRSIKQYQNALRQLKWDTFDKSMETVKRVNSEADYYIDLLSHKDMTDKDTGNFTEYGIATIGLHKTNYDNYIAQAEAYQSEYDKIMKQIEKGELSASDENVIQRLRDLQDAHREAKKSAEDELESINDLVKQGYEAQTDALSKLIEKFKKLKDSELEAYKYQKEIAEKTKQIASLQKQLTAYTGNNSEESRATIQKLKVELENAKSDLKDTQYEKFISDTEDMLDDLMSDYQEFIDEKINDTNTILDSIKELLGGNDGIIATLKSLDSSLTNTTKDQIDSSTTNGGDGGQGAKDYVNNTVTNDRNTINSSHKTGLLRPTAVGTITLDNSLESKKKNTTSIDDKLKNEKKAVKDAINSGKSRSKKLTDKENQEHADLWKYIVKNYGRTPTNKMYKKLGGILGVKTDDTVTSKQKTAILNRMKFNGYKKGSEHIDKSQLAWTQEDKREMIYRASDGAVLTKLNPGDKVFTNEMTENLWKMAQVNPSLLTSGINYMPNLPEITKSAGTSTIVEVGDIVMNGVNDVETFGRQLREEILRNGKTTQCITEAVSAKQLGRNSVGNARLYK